MTPTKITSSVHLHVSIVTRVSSMFSSSSSAGGCGVRDLQYKKHMSRQVDVGEHITKKKTKNCTLVLLTFFPHDAHNSRNFCCPRVASCGCIVPLYHLPL